MGSQARKELSSNSDAAKTDNDLQQAPLSPLVLAQLEIAKFQRGLLLKFHKEGSYSDEVIRKMEQELDIDDMRLNTMAEKENQS